jgi:hypothetical protein
LNETEAVAAQRTRKRLGDLFMWLSTHALRSKWTIKNAPRDAVMGKCLFIFFFGRRIVGKISGSQWSDKD